jgi:hypothetical protein
MFYSRGPVDGFCLDVTMLTLINIGACSFLKEDCTMANSDIDQAGPNMTVGTCQTHSLSIQ